MAVIFQSYYTLLSNIPDWYVFVRVLNLNLFYNKQLKVQGVSLGILFALYFYEDITYKRTLHILENADNFYIHVCILY